LIAKEMDKRKFSLIKESFIKAFFSSHVIKVSLRGILITGNRRNSKNTFLTISFKKRMRQIYEKNNID